MLVPLVVPPPELELPLDVVVLVAATLEVEIIELGPLLRWANGSRPWPLSRDLDWIDWTLSAGSAVVAGGTGAPCGSAATGVLLEDLDSAIGTATIATSSTTATGNSRFARRSARNLVRFGRRSARNLVSWARARSMSRFIGLGARRRPAA